MEIFKRIGEFDSAHILPQHTGKCANLHGHRYRVDVHVQGKIQMDTGMVMDFGAIKNILRVSLEDIDHALIVAADDPDDLMNLCLEMGWKIYNLPYPTSTAECLALHFQDLIVEDLVRRNYHDLAISVTVWETPTAHATTGFAPIYDETKDAPFTNKFRKALEEEGVIARGYNNAS